MSNAIFPALLGQKWPVKKTPAFSTIEQKSVTGLRKAISLQPYPIWTFELSYDYLSDNGSPTDDIHTLAGFFLDRYGSFDDFLFNDVTDNTVANQLFGIGDGAATQFQLVRSYKDFIEPILGVQGSPVISCNPPMAGPNATFSRPSIANNNEGVQVANGVPRFESTGLTVEEGTTNLLPCPTPTSLTGLTTYNVTWNNGIYFADNAVTRYSYQSPALSPSTTYTFSVNISMNNGSQPVVSSSSNSGDFSIIIANNIANVGTITNLGNNIYRVSGTFTTGATISSNNTGIGKYNSQSANGFTVIGNWQLEQKAYATSFITGTRSPEMLTLPAGVLNANQGTIEMTLQMAEAGSNAPSGVHRGIFVIPGSTWGIFWPNGGHNQIAFALGAWTSVITVGLAWNVGDVLAITARWNLPNATLTIKNLTQGTTATASITNALSVILPSNLNVLTPAQGFTGYANGNLSNLCTSSISRTDADIANRAANGIMVDQYTTALLPLAADLTSTAAPQFTCSTTGMITFATPPAAGTQITWSGMFYYRCHFTADKNEFDNEMQKWWSTSKIEFESVLNSAG